MPPLSGLQFLVLQAIGARERCGKDVREELARHGPRKSLPSFYQLMARLEDSGFVAGSYRSTEIDGQVVKERWYKVTGAGHRANERTRDFYSRAPAVVVPGGARA